MTYRRSQFTSLDLVIRQTRYTLIAFDGPICRLFAEMSTDSVAEQLRHAVMKEGISLQQSTETTADPLDILRFCASAGNEIASRVETRLAELESAAVATALPTPYAHDFLVACEESGRPAAVISTNSLDAVHTYLDLHHLASHVRVVIARSGPDPGFFSLNQHLVEQAAIGLETSPRECAMISSNPTDVQAARGAGASSIGYAQTPKDAENLAAAGAGAVVHSMADLALGFRARLLGS